MAMGPRIDLAGDVITLSLSGPLTLHRVPEVRGLLLRCLTECPAALVVDLSDLVVDSDLPLAVFPAVARRVRAWPGAAPILLCVPPGPVADRLARWRRRRYLTVHGSRDEALAAVGDPYLAPAVRAELPFQPEAQAEARRLVTEACGQWGLADLSPPAELIVSELAGNAVRHAAPPLGLVTAARGAYLHIVARDSSPEPPRVLAPSGGDPVVRDHGLHLVDAVATAWGWLRTAGGKAVWATLRKEPRRSPWSKVRSLWLAGAT